MESFTQYAIYNPAMKLYFRNTTGYGGHWHHQPKLFMRRSDAVSCMLAHKRKGHYQSGWVNAVILPMVVRPL